MSSYSKMRCEREQREKFDREMTKLANAMMTPAEKKASRIREDQWNALAAAEKARIAAEYEKQRLAIIEAALADPYPFIAAAFRKIESGERANLDGWIEKFRKAPAYELSWAQDVVPQAAIRYELAGSLAKWFEAGKDPEPDPTDPTRPRLLSEAVRNYLIEEARRLACTLERSTSVTSNWVENNKRIVYCEWADQKGWSSDALRIEIADMVMVKMFRFFDAIKLHSEGQHEAAVALLMKWS